MFKFTVHGQSISCQCDVCATDSVDYLKCGFCFSQDWKGLVKTAQFSQNGNTYSVVLTDDVCILPTEITEGFFDISVFGQRPGETYRITTLSVEANMKKSGFIPDGQTPIPPTADLYSQLLQKLDEAAEKIPEKLSEFENDSDYATRKELPTKVSELENDARYVTPDYVPTKVSQLENDAEYALEADVPTKASELENDAGYVKSQNDGDVEIKTLVSNIYPAYFRLVNGSLRAEVFGYGGVVINSSATKGVQIKQLAGPKDPYDAANKAYVDGLVGDIETALDGIIALQNSLTGGDAV